MREAVACRTFGDQKLAFRIGINSGLVVAGVIGRKKFIYDLWGAAVNLASRMESHGESGTIQITRSTYDLIKDQWTCLGKVESSSEGKRSISWASRSDGSGRNLKPKPFGWLR
jgi:adenylate cyclase